jgi:hypothetical protein
MGRVPAMYDICICNHEAMSHEGRTKKCFTNVPIGRRFFRGCLPDDCKTEKCYCKQFKFSPKNTADPKPTLIGDN